MKKWLFLLFFLPVVAYSQGITNKKAYELVSQVFKKKENYILDLALIPYNNSRFKTSEILTLDYLKQHLLAKEFETGTSSLDQDDLNYMARQVEKYNSLKKLNGKLLSIRSEHFVIDENRSQQEQLFPNFKTYKVSWPLFSKNKKIALLYKETYCGIECGGGQFDMYVLDENDVWQWTAAIPIWVG